MYDSHMAVQQTKVTVNVRDDILADVRQIAEDDNKTVTEVVNEALRFRALAKSGTVLLKSDDGVVSQIVI